MKFVPYRSMSAAIPPVLWATIGIVSTGLLFGCGGGKSPTGGPPGGGGGIFSAAHTQQWVTQVGTGTVTPEGLAGDTLTGIAIDPQGNVGVSASTLGSFPGFSNPGGSEDVILKIDSSGRILWTRQFGTGQGDFLQCIASDQGSNFYVGGSTLGAFPGYINSSGQSQAVVAKFDSSGNRLWLSQFPVLANSTDIATIAIATGSQGNVIVGGYANPSGNAPRQIFIASLDAATGNQRWLAQFAPAAGVNVAADYLNSVAVDSSGNIFASGNTQGSFPGTPGGTSGPFLLKLDASGTQQWVQQFSSELTGIAANLFSIATARDGNIIAGGATSTANAIVVGQGADRSDKGLLAKIDGSTGNVVWLNQFSSGAGDEVTSVAVDPQGNIAAAGMTNGVFNPAFSQPNDDIFLTKFNSAGQNIWVQQLGNGPIGIRQGVASSSSVAAGASGNFFVGNVTQGTFPGFSNPNNAVEMFVAKFGP